MARDYYEVLAVAKTCTEVELKSAFRKAAIKHHPDKNPGDHEAEARFKECNEAYAVLSDPQKRAAYDRFGHAGVNGMAGPGGMHGFNAQDIFSEVFGDMFGEVFGGGRRSGGHGPGRGSDLRYDLEITLEQAFAGDAVEIKVPSAQACEACEGTGAKPGTKPQTCVQCAGAGRIRAAQGFFAVERTCPRCGGAGRVIADPCRTCHGIGQVRRDRTLEVRIPPGVDDGARIRLAGEGDSGVRGGPRGDLYIFLSVAPHDLFERDGLDLHCTVPIPMATAALGGEFEAPCLKGGPGCDGSSRETVKAPPGAQTGHTVRLRGKGVPSMRGRERGDLVIELYVETPTDLTARQKQLLQELAESTAKSDRHHPRHAGFFDKARKFWDGVTGQGAEEDARV